MKFWKDMIICGYEKDKIIYYMKQNLVKVLVNIKILKSIYFLMIHNLLFNINRSFENFTENDISK